MMHAEVSEEDNRGSFFFRLERDKDKNGSQKVRWVCLI